jgi:hypothetical protein
VATDDDVRLHIYSHFVAAGRPPDVEETATALGLSQAETEAAYRRLEQQRVIVLAPGTASIWMANPLSATPTSFRVTTARGEHWGACAWDAFGVLAMLGGDGTVHTLCPDCNEAMELRVKGRALATTDGVAHFVVPARRWWENIAFT